MGMESRNFGTRRPTKGRFGGTGFASKDVRYENGAGGVKKTSSLVGGGGGHWSGPVGLTTSSSSGGNYGSGPDWWNN